MGVPNEAVIIKNLGSSKSPDKIAKIELLGSKEKIKWSRDSEGLKIEKPNFIANNIAIVFKVYQK